MALNDPSNPVSLTSHHPQLGNLVDACPRAQIVMTTPLSAIMNVNIDVMRQELEKLEMLKRISDLQAALPPSHLMNLPPSISSSIQFIPKSRTMIKTTSRLVTNVKKKGDNRFRRYSWQFEDDPLLVLIQYVGDETIKNTELPWELQE